MTDPHKCSFVTASVTVFGGTGFLGRGVVSRVAEDGAMVRVAVRHPERVDAGAITSESGCINQCQQTSAMQPRSLQQSPEPRRW